MAPRSPYAASKASGDLMALAYYVTYGLPVTITRGANNIGPYQYPEKVVPLFVTNAIDDLPLPVYGDGKQRRDYQYVMDHCEGIDVVLHRGEIGEVYNIGTGAEMENLAMVEILLDELGKPRSLIQHVEDRPGHDRRYCLNVDKLKALGWQPRHTPRGSHPRHRALVRGERMVVAQDQVGRVQGVLPAALRPAQGHQPCRVTGYRDVSTQTTPGMKPGVVRFARSPSARPVGPDSSVAA